jgi:ankyrin repeat protein
MNILEELLNRGANIDDGIDISVQTPLHMAALMGNVTTVAKLIRRGANLNAIASDIGPVINAAIRSGNRDAVKLLVEAGVSLVIDDSQFYAPLSLAIALPDTSMPIYLMEAYADRLPAEEYQKAMFSAATHGKKDMFIRLIPRVQNRDVAQVILKTAAKSGNWDIVLVALENYKGLQCDEIFTIAATGVEEQDNVLEAIWTYTNGGLSAETLAKSLYMAADREKESTVKMLLQKFKANPNATGGE